MYEGLYHLTSNLFNRARENLVEEANPPKVGGREPN